MAMDRLWTPWRYNYVSKAKPAGRPGVPDELESWPGPDADCVFCNLIRAVDWGLAQGIADAERFGLVVARWPGGYCCLNRYPYASGHVLVVPLEHTDSLAKLPAVEAAAMMAVTQRVERALRTVYKPDGINLGVNMGEAAGAGVAAHLHLHAVPRWFGDTNFMTVTGETRILPELLDQSWARLNEAMREQ